MLRPCGLTLGVANVEIILSRRLTAVTQAVYLIRSINFTYQEYTGASKALKHALLITTLSLSKITSP
jgi:hypothetical protein